MNWEAIGAIGEVVGAAGVVATLLYLAVQVRLSRQATDPTPRSTAPRPQPYLKMPIPDSTSSWHPTQACPSCSQAP
jgi:hypothetical protein